MATFSVAGSAVAGFGLIGRKPLAVAVWALAIALLLFLPSVGMVAAMGPQFIELIEVAARSSAQASSPDPAVLEQVTRMQSGMMAFNLISWIGGTAIRALICAAIFRAVLTPADSRFAYLRIGVQEAWLTLLFLVETVLAAIAMGVGVLLVILAAAAAGFAAGMGAKGDEAVGVMTALGVGGVGYAALLGVAIWVALRLSMAAPITFAQREFRLFESWSLTAGRSWALLGVGVLLVVMLLVFQIVVGGLLAGGGLIIAAGAGLFNDPQRIAAFFHQPPTTWLSVLWPWILVGGLAWAILASIVMTIFCAPWAAIYKALTAPAPVSQDVSPSPVSPS